MQPLNSAHDLCCVDGAPKFSGSGHGAMSAASKRPLRPARLDADENPLGDDLDLNVASDPENRIQNHATPCAATPFASQQLTAGEPILGGVWG
jgi:hypothetical protein